DVLGDQPDEQGQDENRRGIPGGKPVDGCLGFCFGVLGLFHAVDNPRQSSFRSDTGGFHLQESATRNGSGKYLIGCRLGYGHGFTGHGGLITGPGPSNHFSVDWNLCTVFHYYNFTSAHLIGGTLLLLTIA